MVYFLPWRGRASSSFFGEEKAGQIPPELDGLPPELEEVEYFLDWADVDTEAKQTLTRLALPVSQHSRVAPEVLRQTILELCNRRYLGVRVLARLLNRNPDDLRKRTLSPMVNAKLLKQAFPSNNDPRQAYASSGMANKGNFP